MPRFVILRHTGAARGEHFDFLIETGDVLKAWSLPREPAPGVEMDCQQLPDHRLEYLDYEGPVSDNRGSVVRWDEGLYIGIAEEAAGQRSDGDFLTIQLAGRRIAGRIELRRSPEEPTRWRLTMKG